MAHSTSEKAIREARFASRQVWVNLSVARSIVSEVRRCYRVTAEDSPMLLVARRVGEALRIGTNIEVKVVAATRSRVMLAVTAPRELNIRRIYGKSDYKNVDLNETGETQGPEIEGQEEGQEEAQEEGQEADAPERKAQVTDE